jgi:hypothetical protein
MGKEDSVEIKLVKLKETKTTWCYEATDGAPLRTIYVNKGTFSRMPDAIRLTLEAVRPSSDEAG